MSDLVTCADARARRRQRWLCALAIVAFVAGVYWPGVYGFWGRDDFMQLAMARLLGTPWPLFVQDHFPAPGAVFRPLGFASMWLCATLFGTDYLAHAVADMALHAGVGLALFGLLRRLAIPATIALACTLMFALHPAVIGTALWWSARFDLLATLFVLLALCAACAYRERPGAIALLSALAAALAAMLSKEIGLVVVLPLSLLWLQWAIVDPAQRWRAVRAIGSAWLCAVVYLVWRWLVLGTASSGLTGALPVSRAIAKGLLDWLHQAPGYLSFWTRLDTLPRVALVAAALSLLLLVGRTGVRLGWRRHGVTALVGVCLFTVPALLQSPVAALNAAPLSADMSAIEAAMQSRLYYLGIAGVATLLAGLLAASAAVLPAHWRPALLVPPLLVALTFAPVSRDAARAFATRSQAIAAVAREAVAAVDQLDLPATHCHVAFLGVEPPPEWSRYVSMDSIVKALSPDLGRVGHCYVHADYVTYFDLLAAPASAADAAPYRPLAVDGVALPWRRLGNLVIAYLRPPPTAAAQDLAHMIFLRRRAGAFEDVSAAVTAGQLPVRLE